MYYAVFARETDPMIECVYIIRGNLLDWFVQRELGIPILAVWRVKEPSTCSVLKSWYLWSPILVLEARVDTRRFTAVEFM